MNPIFRQFASAFLTVSSVVAAGGADTSAHTVASSGTVAPELESPNTVHPKLVEFAKGLEKAGLQVEVSKDDLKNLEQLAREVPLKQGLFTNPNAEKPTRLMQYELFLRPEATKLIGHGQTALHKLAATAIDPPEAKQKLAKILLDRGADPFMKTSPGGKTVFDLCKDDEGFSKFLSDQIKK